MTSKPAGDTCRLGTSKWIHSLRASLSLLTYMTEPGFSVLFSCDSVTVRFHTHWLIKPSTSMYTLSWTYCARLMWVFLQDVKGTGVKIKSEVNDHAGNFRSPDSKDSFFPNLLIPLHTPAYTFCFFPALPNIYIFHLFFFSSEFLYHYLMCLSHQIDTKGPEIWNEGNWEEVLNNTLKLKMLKLMHNDMRFAIIAYF